MNRRRLFTSALISARPTHAERPFGSVRWKDDVPDRAATDVLLSDFERGRMR